MSTLTDTHWIGTFHLNGVRVLSAAITLAVLYVVGRLTGILSGLDSAEKQGFDTLVTTNSKLKYQQDMKARHIAIVVLSTPSWPRIQLAIAAVVGAVRAASTGSYTEVDIP